MSIISAYTMLLSAHVKDGLGRPFLPGVISDEWQSRAIKEKWGIIHCGMAAEKSWIGFLKGVKNADGNPIMTIPFSTYKTFKPYKNVVIGGGAYKIKPENGITIVYDSIDVSGVSPGDMWYPNDNEPCLIKGVNKEKRSLVLHSVPPSAYDNYGIGTGIGQVRTGGSMGDIVSSFVNGTDTVKAKLSVIGSGNICVCLVGSPPIPTPLPVQIS